MTPQEVSELLEALPGVKRKGTTEQPAWYVHDRLVARLVEPTTLLVRVPIDAREALLETHRTGFGVPPRYEAHSKVEAYLDEVDPAAVRTAVELAWEMQRH